MQVMPMLEGSKRGMHQRRELIGHRRTPQLGARFGI